MSETPRTDANSWISPESDSGRVCDARFAAELELQLAVAKATFKKATGYTLEEYAKMRQEIANER